MTGVDAVGRPVVLGVGNPWRGDDGVGAAVARAVAERLDRLDGPGGTCSAGVEVVEVDGEPARLVEAWAGRPLAVVVDAVVSGAEPGTVHRVVVVGEGASGGDLGTAPATGGSHALGAGEAVRLGRALDRLPRRLVVLGVEGSAFDHTADVALQPAVAAAVATVVDAVLAELAEVAPCA